MKILILCTGNSCRSQIAQGYLQSFDKDIKVYSAGTVPASKINPVAVRVMAEDGIDISGNSPEKCRSLSNEEWDYVITVCDEANEACPFFPGKVNKRLHFGFEDPSNFKGTDTQVINEFRRTRDKIKDTFYKFYNDFLI